MKKTTDYSIGGHTLRVDSGSLNGLLEAAGGFDTFLSAVKTHPDTMLTLCERPYPQNTKEYTPLYRFRFEDKECSFGSDNAGKYFFRIFPPEGQEPFFMEYDVHTRTAFANAPGNAALVRFGLWMAYGMALAKDMTVAVHSSAISYNGQAVLFLGESGTGKSTHTRLWTQNIKGAGLINDDSPILRVENNTVYAYGSPWSGKTPCYRTEKYPVAAIVRLSQAPHNSIKKLRIPEALAALHPSCPPAFAYDNVLYDGISATISAILEKTPVFHLECLADPDAAYTSFGAIFSDKNVAV